MLQALTFYKARQLEKQKKWQQAFDLYNQYASGSTDVSGKLAYRLGFVAEKLKKNDVALKWLKLAVQKEPQNARWHARLAKVAVQAGKYQIAVDAYADKGTQVFSEASWYYDLGWLLEKNKNYEQAADFYRNAVQLDPTIANYSYRLGRANQLAENFEAAAKAYKEAIAKGKADADSLICLGRCLKELDDLTEAKAVYLQLLSLEAEAKYHIAAYYQLAEIELTETHYEKVLAYCEQVLEQQVGHAGAWFVQSQSLMALKQGKAAFESLRKAVQLQPKNTEWQMALAIFCQHSGPFSVAANAWGQVLKSDPLNQEWILQHALALDMAAKVPEAIKVYTKLAQLQSDSDTDFEEEKNSIGCYIDALKLYHAKQFKESQESFEKALELYGEEAPAHWYYRLGQALSLGGRAAEAEAHLQRAISLSPLNQYYVYALAQAIRRQGRTWQEVEVLQQTLAVVQDPENANPNIDFIAKWSFELGEAQDKMNRFAEAAEVFAKANCLKPDNAMWYFREGYAWERAGKTRQAQQAYDLAIAADKNLKANEFGIGVFHQQRGFWPQAAEAYAQRAKNELWNAELQYRLGFAHDRCYRWEQAEQCYRQALVFKPHQPDWHYRLAFVLERQEKWLEAARFYRFAATTKNKHTPYWFYRLGYVLNKAGEQEKACQAFLQTRTQVQLPTLPTASVRFIPADLTEHELEVFVEDYSQQQKLSLQRLLDNDAALESGNQAQAYYALGQQAERLEMWQAAAELYQQAVKRSNEHQSEMYYRLGYVLAQLQQYKEAIRSFLDTELFRSAGFIDDPMSLLKTVATKKVVLFAEFQENHNIQHKTIFYESYGGIWLACNPLTLFEELLRNPDFKDYTHVLSISDPSFLKDEWKKENVIVVQKDTDLYIYHLATARYIIHNSSLPPYYVRRDGQNYLNTWHGTPLKYLGKHIKDSFMEHRWSTRNRLQATHLIHPNTFTETVLLEHCDIENIITAPSVVTGYPRNDKVITPRPGQVENIKRRLGICDKRPVVLYAPTWRGELNEFVVDSDHLMKDISAMQDSKWHLIFRGHYFSEKKIREAGLAIEVVPADIDTSELLPAVDLLITDYSSIFFDYLPRKKPIIHYAYDQQEYEKKRGMYFPLAEMPGTICQNRSDLQSLINNTLEEEYIPNARHIKCLDQFCFKEDAESTGRVINFFFSNKYEKQIHKKINVTDLTLVYAGDFCDTAVYENLCGWLREGKNRHNNILIIIEPNHLLNKVSMSRYYKLVNDGVRFICRAGRRYANLEQEYLFNQKNSLSINSVEIEHLLDRQYKREFQRLFGFYRFKDMIVFDKNSDFWNLIKKYNFGYGVN